MTLPTIHLNGTSPQMLLEGYQAARLAVGDAIRALEAIEFNSRDYYPQGPGAWNSASWQMTKRRELLESVQTELATIEMHCQDKIDAREAQKL
jgi:hypothetical protein